MRKQNALKWIEEQKEYTDRRVNYGIEQYRKSSAMLAFFDKNGKPVKNISFKARLKQHEFDFGCNLFLLDEFESEEKNTLYRELFSQVFNYATIPFYWKDIEPQKGKLRFSKDSPRIYRRPAPDLCVEFCKENNIKMKGHCLAYEGFAPDWVSNEKGAYIKELTKRFSEISKRYSGIIEDWDVTNETFNWHPSYSVTPLYRDPDYMKICYGLAAEFFRHNKKIVNENFGIWYPSSAGGFSYCNSPFYLQLENMILKGIDFDACGFQIHQFVSKDGEKDYAKNRYNPKYVYDVLDTFARLGKTIQLSEVTIASYTHEEEDMEIQAEIAKEMYKIWFSHPAVTSIIYWNMADGYTYNPNGSGVCDMSCGENVYDGGLLKPDLSPKPVYNTLKKLIKEEWNTCGEFCTAKDSNYASFRGFKGTYELEINFNGKCQKKEFYLTDTDFDDFACDSTVKIVLD